MKFRKAVCIQGVKVQVLCSSLRVAESSMTPESTTWKFGGSCLVSELYFNRLDDLCCKRDLLGLMCLCSYPLLLSGALSISVQGFYQYI